MDDANNLILTSPETVSTASELTVQTLDIVDLMLYKCSTELVEYILSFTTLRHASAAGFFKLCLSFPSEELSQWPSKDASINFLRDALHVGDLPLARYLIFKSQSPGIMSTVMSAMNWEDLEDVNAHVFMYFYHLIDCGAVSWDHEHLLYFTKLRDWATEMNHTYWLNFLYRSTFSRRNQQSFANWKIVSKNRMMNILEYAHEHHCFGPNDTDIMNQILEHSDWYGWGAGLEFCHVSGKRFLTWGPTDLMILSNPLNSEFRAVMHKFKIFPKDMCLGCRDQWFLRIGYWGLVEAYKYHKGLTAHTCSDFQQALVLDDEMVNGIGNSGWEYGDVHVLQYLTEYGSKYSQLWIFSSFAKDRNVEILRSICERYECAVRLLYLLPLLEQNDFVNDLRMVATARESRKKKRAASTRINCAVVLHLKELDVEWEALKQTLKWDLVTKSLQMHFEKLRTFVMFPGENQSW